MKKFLLFLVTLTIAIFYSNLTLAYNKNIENEFESLEILEDENLDRRSRRRIARMVESVYNRFCNMKVPPESVAISIGLVEVTWSIETLCRFQNAPEIKHLVSLN